MIQTTADLVMVLIFGTAALFALLMAAEGAIGLWRGVDVTLGHSPNYRSPMFWTITVVEAVIFYWIFGITADDHSISLLSRALVAGGVAIYVSWVIGKIVAMIGWLARRSSRRSV